VVCRTHHLGHGPCGCFLSECCTDGESMASPCVNCSLAPTHLCQGWTVKYCFTSLEHDLTKNKTQPISFGGTYSTNCTTMNKILAFMIDRSTPWSCDMRQGSNYGTDRQKGNTFTFDSHCT